MLVLPGHGMHFNLCLYKVQACTLVGRSLRYTVQLENTVFW